MADIKNKAFWDAVAANGPVPYDELGERVAEVLEDHPEWARLPDADTFVLYSGNMTPDGQGSATQAAQDLGARGNGTIGIIDNTPAGRALGEMTDSLNNSTLEAKFGSVIDFSDAPMTSTEWTVAAKSIDPAIKAEAWGFSGDLYATFKPSSQAFAEQLTGRVITVTPEAKIGRDFRTQEVPSLVERVESGHVTHVNGVPANEITARLEGLTGEAKFDAAFEHFNESFRETVRANNIDAHFSETNVDGRTVSETRLDVDQNNINAIGGSPNAKLDPPNLVGMRPLKIGADHVTDIEADRSANSAEPDNSPNRSGSTASAGNSASASLDDINAELRTANSQGHLKSFVADPDAMTAHLFNTENGRLYEVTEGRVSGVTQFDSVEDARSRFQEMHLEAARAHPKAFRGSVPDLHNDLGSLGNHIDDLARPAWRRTLGNVGDTAGDLLGKGSKILGPLGVAAAGHEVYTLEAKLHDLAKIHDIPKEAMLEYHANMGLHATQATVDPTLLGGEIVIQANHDRWGAKYGLEPELIEALEPGSLLEDVHAAKTYLEARAMMAGMEMRDYAVDRFNNPEKFAEDAERIGEAVMDGAEYVFDKGADAVEAVGDYASARWDDPSKLGDDAIAIRDAAGDAATATGDAIVSGGKAFGGWVKSFWEEDEPSVLEKSLGEGGEGLEIPIERVVRQINSDYAPAQAEIGARAQDATLDLDAARVGKMLSQTGTSAIYPGLRSAGLETVTLPPHDYTQPLDRVDAALRAGVEEMKANNLPAPSSEYVPEADRTGISNESYAEAAVEGPERGTQMIREELEEAQADRAAVAERDDKAVRDADAEADYDAAY